MNLSSDHVEGECQRSLTIASSCRQHGTTTIHDYDGMIMFIGVDGRFDHSIIINFDSIFKFESEMRNMNADICYIYRTSACSNDLKDVLIE